MNKFHKETLLALKTLYEMKQDHELTPAQLELREWLAEVYKHSNKGIKGRGISRHVRPITTLTKKTMRCQQKQPQQPQQQQQQQLPQPAVQFNMPIQHLPPPHPTLGQHHVGSGFPPSGLQRNAPQSHHQHSHQHHQGSSSLLGRGSHQGYEMYDMDHSGGMEGHSPGSGSGSSTAGSALDEDHHRGLGFQDRYQERVYEDYKFVGSLHSLAIK